MGIHLMMSNAFRSIGSYVSLRPEEAFYQHKSFGSSYIFCLLPRPFSMYFLYSSSFSSPCLLAPPPPPPPPPSACNPLPPPATVLGCCDVFVYSTTPPCMPPQYFGCFPLFLLLFHVSSCSYTEASVSACLPVANKVSPLFVGASFWRGRPSSKLIVHSLAFACRNLTT